MFSTELSLGSLLGSPASFFYMSLSLCIGIPIGFPMVTVSVISFLLLALLDALLFRFVSFGLLLFSIGPRPFLTGNP